MFWGKVLYYSLSSILIDRDELESLCDAVGFPKGRSNRTAMGDAFRSATGDIYERRVVKPTAAHRSSRCTAGITKVETPL
ncbi:MAG: DUF6744 family protein [Enterocloster sp.]|uniref:DUF6744 family protein n=1 Tax=Enterocloster sp. TaxID=2719315 RepID=UPI00399C1590